MGDAPTAGGEATFAEALKSVKGFLIISIEPIFLSRNKDRALSGAF